MREEGATDSALCRLLSAVRGLLTSGRDLVLDRRVGSPQDQPRIERQRDDAGEERSEDGGVAKRDLPRLPALRQAIVHGALEEANRVVGGEGDADRGDERVDDLRLEDAEQ